MNNSDAQQIVSNSSQHKSILALAFFLLVPRTAFPLHSFGLQLIKARLVNHVSKDGKRGFLSPGADAWARQVLKQLCNRRKKQSDSEAYQEFLFSLGFIEEK